MSLTDDFIFRHEQSNVPVLTDDTSLFLCGPVQRLTDDGRVVEEYVNPAELMQMDAQASILETFNARSPFF